MKTKTEWLNDLGFYLEEQDNVWVLFDSISALRDATMSEQVLWTKLMKQDGTKETLSLEQEEHQATQVIIDFAQVGTAGPFPVVDGRVQLSVDTMQDLVRMLRPTYEAEQPHPDDTAVDRFAEALKAKLAAARAKGRGGWDTPECTQQRLSDMLREHVDKGDPRDVANFCLFLWARGEAIAPPAEQPATPKADATTEAALGGVYAELPLSVGEQAAQRLRELAGISQDDVTDPLHPRYIEGYKAGHAAGRKRAAPQQEPAGEVVSASCDHATVRWLHQTSSVGGGDPCNSRSWPITGDKVYLAPQPAPAPLTDELVIDLAGLAPNRKVCASTCMTRKFDKKPCECYPGMRANEALEFARAIEQAHGITQKGGSVTAPAVASEPIAYLYDDGSWTPAKTEEGRKLNDWMISAGSPKIGVHLASTAQPTPLTTLAQATQAGNQQEARIALSGIMTAQEPPVLASRAWPKVSGVSRDEGHSRALLVFFAAEPTDDEVRAVHDTLAAQPAPLSDDVVRDAAFEAVRKKLCALPRFSFITGPGGGIRQVADKTGSWIDFDAAHALFDPVSVDAALAAQGGK